MKVILESEGQDAFILEGEGDRFYLFDRRAMRCYGPAPRLRLTRHGRWQSFGGEEELVLGLLERAENAPLSS